ncbi:CotH kinase family protein, partial [Providencia manganoxydans]|uniref:CotH kinase family protein n=2 Tax=Providencia manganoxydans TaxID=2923283 RepID=UPI0032DAAB3C
MTLLKSRHEAENEKMSVMTSLSMLIESLAPLDGFDPQNIIAGTGANVQKFEGAYIAKAPSAVVRIDIETDSNVPSSKEDGKVKCRCKINIDGVEFSAYSTMAVQGSSAVYFPKKNLTLAFFKDENYDKSVELKIGDGLPHDEWVYKANYVDSTHLRNLFGYRFWERIRDSRNTWPQREIDFYYEGKTGFDAIDTGATGLPKGYPCVLYVNSAFYGIGDITIGKKRKNYNMAKDKPNNIYLALNNCDLLTLNVEDESIVEVKTPATITDEFNGYIQDWRDFANLSQTEFTAALPSKLNPLNVIDYYILVQTLCLSDCLNRNVLMQTWDGNKWFFMPYDLKGCLGINPQGNALLDYDFDPVVDGSIHQGTKDFWIKVKTA